MIDIPDGFCVDIDDKLDLAGAVGAYGEPVTRQASLDVNADSIAYWQRVRRKRVAEAVLVIPDGQGGFLVHTKAFYPQGAYRLLSGGIKAHEALRDAVVREAHEETGHHAEIERFLGVIWTSFCHQGQEERFASYLFLLKPVGGTIHSLDAHEQITDYRFVSLDDLGGLADDLESLEPSWVDWGRFRAVGHRLCVELLRPA